MKLKGLFNFLRPIIGYRVIAGFDDVADFEYYSFTAQGALDWMKAHPANCFVQVVNRFGEVVAERY